MTVLDIISLDQLQRLREAGYVVVHRVPTEAMLKAGLSCFPYHYADIAKEYHRMVAESIRSQNKEIQKCQQPKILDPSSTG